MQGKAPLSLPPTRPRCAASPSRDPVFASREQLTRPTYAEPGFRQDRGQKTACLVRLHEWKVLPPELCSPVACICEPAERLDSREIHDIRRGVLPQPSHGRRPVGHSDQARSRGARHSCSPGSSRNQGTWGPRCKGYTVSQSLAHLRANACTDP